MKWIKSSERLPTQGGDITWRWLDKKAAYSGFNGKEFLYDVGGSRVDMLYKNEIEWLDESEQPSTDGWVEGKVENLPLEIEIIVEHKYGIDAIHFWNHRWRYWYSGHEAMPVILETVKRFMICKKGNP